MGTREITCPALSESAESGEAAQGRHPIHVIGLGMPVGGNWPSQGGSLGSEPPHPTPQTEQLGMGLEGRPGLPQVAFCLPRARGADMEWGLLLRAGCNKGNHEAAGSAPSFQEVWSGPGSLLTYLLINWDCHVLEKPSFSFIPGEKPAPRRRKGLCALCWPTETPETTAAT